MSDVAQPDRSDRLAMRLSLAVGFLMLVGKVAAYVITGSAAILSDAAESVIHVVAVGFAAFSLHLGSLPASAKSPYGFDRIAFLSAGFEGGMITIAAIWIIAAAIQKWRAGLVLEQLGWGLMLTIAASLINLALGLYLRAAGRRTHSLILEANGTHVLTDSWTSFGVVAGLVLVMATGWKPFDPLVAIAVALNILYSAGQLLRKAWRGLLDLPDPRVARKLQDVADELCRGMGLGYHRLRFRDTGRHILVSVHLLFPYSAQLGDAHRQATEFERRLQAAVDFPVEVFSHLEAADDHACLHPDESPGW